MGFYAALVLGLLMWPEEGSGKNVLMVTDGNGVLNAAETSRRSQLQSWGHTVTTVWDGATQSAINSALANIDVVYVPVTVTDWELGYKLRTTTAGVVNEERYLDEEFGFSDNPGWDNASFTQIVVTNNTHPVTTGLALGNVTIFSSTQPLALMNPTHAPGLQVLANQHYGAGSLAVLEKSATLANTYNGNSTASGRRVRLPWGGDSLNIAALNSNAQLIAKNAIDWAGGGAVNGPLIGHWRLDETSGTTAADASPNALHGTVAGSPTRGVAAPHGFATNFSASGTTDRISLPRQALHGLSTISVSFWINTTKTGEQAVLSGAKSGGDNEVLLLFGSDTEFRLYFHGTMSTWTIPSIATGTWRHVVVRSNATTNQTTLYLDGVSMGNRTTSAGGTPFSIDPGGLIVGQEQDSVGGSFDALQRLVGRLDDLRIYDVVLTATEIAELYGHRGHWTFDNGSGSTISDSTSFANHATFYTGSPSWAPGRRSAALAFNGSNDARTNANVTPPTEGTIAFWLRSAGPPTSRQRLWGIGADFEAWQDPDGLLVWDLGADGSAGGVSTFTPLYEAGRWYHVAVVYSDINNSFTIYLDGKLHKAGISSSGFAQQAAGRLMFGNRSGTTERFIGRLDDFHLFSRKLTQAEIVQLYGFVGHWRLNESAGTVASDESGAANHGTYTGSPLLAQPGPYPGNGAAAVGFNTSSKRVTVPDAPSLHVSGTLSLLAWTYVSEYPTLGVRDVISKDHGGVSSSYRLSVSSDGALRLTANSGNPAGGTPQLVVSSAAGAVREARWHHLAATYDGSLVRLYVDGQLVAQEAHAITFGDAGYGVTLGGQPANWLYGAMFDARVYNRALDPLEIAEIYGLVGWWKLDETLGATAYDYSGFDRHATWVGTPGWSTAGRVDGAAELNGSQRIVVPTFQANASDVSMTAWAYLVTPDSSGAELVSMGDCFAIRLTPTTASTFYYNGSTWQTATGGSGTGGGGWRHYAAVFSQQDNQLTLYVDGVAVSSVAAPSPIVWSGLGANLVIGAHGDGGTTWDFTGQIDDVRFYNRAIASDEVMALYESGFKQGLRIIRWLEVR